MATRKIAGLIHPSNTVHRSNVISYLFTQRCASSDSNEKITHTGQAFDENDYRLVRFVDKQKEVNNNWAIKLIAEVPPAQTKDRIVACDGGGGPLGHPKVYINLDKPGNHICGYCGLRFYKEDHHH